MKCKAAVVWIFSGCVMAVTPAFFVLGQSSKDEKQKPQSGAAQQQPAQQPQTNGNPFPEDVNSVPVMPSGNGPDVTEAVEEASNPDAAPPKDSDPVRSPEEMAPTDNGATEGFSSSRSGLDNLVPEPDTEPTGRRVMKADAMSMVPHETADKDVDVGNYYMDRKDWKGALSRFQSALVLAPDNPDVYWGLAECYRHTGQFAEARTNYEKVAEFDPDSKHGKDAKKALKEPELAKAGGTGSVNK